MTLVLALDTVTSGLPPRNAAKGDDAYPWAAAVAGILFSLEDGTTHGLLNTKIRSDNRSMQAGATAVHGITDRDAARGGVSAILGLGMICSMAAEARYLIGFNIAFDRNVIESDLIKLKKNPRMLIRPGLTVLDLMEPAAMACKIPSERDTGGYKWPSLDVATATIRKERKREGRHNALADAQRARRLFLSLLARGTIELPGLEAAA